MGRMKDLLIDLHNHGGADEWLEELETRYQEIREKDPRHYDLLDALTIESIICQARDAKSESSRAYFLPKLESLIGAEPEPADFRGAMIVEKEVSRGVSHVQLP